jgi:NAD(P)-dependent dehydrogenase (short-subunit alcohol dehydrogenase family)
MFDLLFVSAGVTNGPEEATADVTTEEFTRLMITNALSPMRVIERLGALVDPKGTIAIMSSGPTAARLRRVSKIDLVWRRFRVPGGAGASYPQILRVTRPSLLAGPGRAGPRQDV